ncbi:MAG: hypothetical protein KBC57_05745 [Neisseriaceae bacterium]|nr:hypothetical protein [Neisseriaceae bacterium]MBP6861843.1 hypothetical protein [Neisseriaceae bacterium]
MTQHSNSPYPEVEGIDSALFQLSADALSPADRAEAMQQLKDYVAIKKKYFLGYQANQALDYAGELDQYLDVQMNNIGDPFQTGNFKLNTKWIERSVLDYFAELWHVPTPHLEMYQENGELNGDIEDIGNRYWGYVVSMGSTEGNLYGIRNARDYLHGKILAVDTATSKQRMHRGFFHSAKDGAKRLSHTETAYQPVLFYSRATHYSIDKIKDILLFDTFSEVGKALYSGECPITDDGEWPEHVPTYADDSINLEDLYKLVDFFAGKGHPIAVNFNYGTTFRGAYDDIEGASAEIIRILEKHGIAEREFVVNINGTEVHSKRDGYWFHVDGALGAAYGPFFEMLKAEGLLGEIPPQFDFRNPIHSISMSGHKEIGAPWPCGIYMTRTRYLLNFSNVSYIGSQDSTLSGSRNGFSALILWHYLSRHSHQDQKNKLMGLLNMAQYAYDQLKTVRTPTGVEWRVHRAENSLSVLFRRPNQALVSKYSLSTEFEEGFDYAHLFAMEHVTKATIDALVHDLNQPGAFFEPEEAEPHAYARSIVNPGTGFR